MFSHSSCRTDKLFVSYRMKNKLKCIVCLYQHSRKRQTTYVSPSEPSSISKLHSRMCLKINIVENMVKSLSFIIRNSRRKAIELLGCQQSFCVLSKSLLLLLHSNSTLLYSIMDASLLCMTCCQCSGKDQIPRS